MEMGELLRQARLDAGLTQRELCGDRITRNMLSQIENGAARPSMATLQYLADALGKPVSYFLGETVLTENQQLMLKARQAFSEKRYRATLAFLEDYAGPDPTLDWERGLLGCLCCLNLAEEAAREGRRPVARKLLGQARRFESPYIIPELRTRQALLAQLLGQKPQKKQLPSLDGELLLRARLALDNEDPERALALLAAMEVHEAEALVLEGKAHIQKKNYSAAFTALEQAERLGEPCYDLLELCCRERKDFEKAYTYACRVRESGHMGSNGLICVKENKK